jgi:hypothetical protein
MVAAMVIKCPMDSVLTIRYVRSRALSTLEQPETTVSLPVDVS